MMSGTDHEDEDARLVSLSEDVERTLIAAHDPQTQAVVVSVKLHRLVKKGLKHTESTRQTRIQPNTSAGHGQRHTNAVHK